MTQLGLPAHCISISTQAKSFAVGANHVDDFSEFEVFKVSGIAATPEFSVNADFSEDFGDSISLKHFSSAVGEWTAVARRKETSSEKKKRYIVFNDEYGYSPIFYSLLPGRELIVSDSFHGVVHELRRKGMEPSLDIYSYLASITTKDSRFSNPFVSKTFSNSIQILPPHKFLHISDESISVHDRSEFLADLVGSPSGLVEAGVDFISRTLSSLASNDNFKRTLLLSGGVDSRTVLSLVVHANAEEAFSLRTNDPRLYKNKYANKVFEDDFYISHQLGNDLGMDWQGVRESFRIETSLEESMILAQSYSSNFSNSFVPASHHQVHKNAEISLRGGGGEPIKGAGFLSLKKQVEEHQKMLGNTGRDAFEKFSNWYVENALIKTRLQGEVGEALNGLATHFESQDFDTAMPYLYQQTRNRTHFGHAKYSSSSNLFPLQPLSNSYFYEASKSIEKTDLRNFALTKEIFQAAAPELLRYPFESDDATEKLTQTPRRKISTGSSILESHFARLASTRSPSTVVTQSGSYKDRFLGDKASALVSMCRSLAHDIEDAFAEHRETLKTAHREALAAIELGVLNPSTTASRMRAARDVFRPTIETGVAFRVKTDERPIESIEIVGIKHPEFAAPKKLQNPEVLPQVVLKPVVSESEGKITVKSNPDCTRPFPLEFAFYLLANGRAVRKNLYQAESEMDFELPDDYAKSSLSVKVFARYSGLSYPCAIAIADVSV
ncbi:hypothetical protein [Corynebacterium casei]|uniref:hypothetical protein n=1 Tax=Corynebacterium casei TaxID=160386 RepID=UPI003FD185F9